MATLPTPGGDTGTWGDELNTFLSVSLDSGGAVKSTAAYIPGGTDVAVADGGTGSSTAATARTALGIGWEKLADSLLAVDTATIDLTSISASYLQLLAVGTLRGATAATQVACNITFNNDTGANYDMAQLQGAGGTASSTEAFAANNLTFNMAANTGTADCFTTCMLLIPNYTAAMNRAAIIWIAHKFGTSSGNILFRQYTGAYRSNTAISRITFTPGTANMLALSRMTLYGLG